MNRELQTAIEFEDLNEFDKAFEVYSNLYLKFKNDYEIWKHYYFFLWNAIEDGTDEFVERINLRKLLQNMFLDGKSLYSDSADFNFIAGYTASIFPYEFGDYEDLEIESAQMLEKASQLEPENLIYKLVYLGSINESEEYQDVKIKAAPKVLEIFSGKGMLNKYFKQVLYRINKQDYR